MPVIECRSRNCTADIKNSARPCVEPTISYEGMVLATYERNGSSDSDFYAIVWDTATENFRHVEYASTRGWTYHNGATVDATEEIMVVAERKLAETLTRLWVESATIAARTPAKGLVVRSLTTRGKNVGISGEVKWVGPDSFRPGATRVGIKVEGEVKLRYVDIAQCEVVDPAPIDEATIKAQAIERARDRRWRYGVMIGGVAVY